MRGDGDACKVHIVRSNRRSVSLRILENGDVEVRAPYGVSDAVVQSFVAANEAWIVERRVQSLAQRERRSQERASTFRDGGAYPLHGQSILLHVEVRRDRKGYCATLLADGKELPSLKVVGPTEEVEAVRECVHACVRKYAKQYLKERADVLSSALGIPYGRLAVRDTKTRWGSCSSAGNLNLHWRLVLLPKPLSDYVIVHELCHRVEMNHSTAFWSLVERVLPDYRLRRRQLKNTESFYMGI